MDRDLDAGAPSDLAGTVVDVGGDVELAGPRPVVDDGRRAHRDDGAGEAGDEVDGAAHRLEVGLGGGAGHGEAGGRGHGEGDEGEAAVVERPGEGRRAAG